MMLSSLTLYIIFFLIALIETQLMLAMIQMHYFIQTQILSFNFFFSNFGATNVSSVTLRSTKAKT